MPEPAWIGERYAGTMKWGESQVALFRRTKRAIRRLLVVEDEPLVAFDNEHALRAAGYEIVATVDRGERALALLDGDAMDAVVLDVGLAGSISGIDVAKAAAALDIPVLFVTGRCPGEARPFAYGCLSKPYLPGHLVAALVAVDALVRGEAPGDLPPGLALFREPVAR